MAAAALGLGLVEGSRVIARLLDDEFSDQVWHTMRQWHHQVIHEGLAAPEPSPGLIRRILDIASDALHGRSLGEEVYLEPLFKRLDDQCNPAQRAQHL